MTSAARIELPPFAPELLLGTVVARSASYHPEQVADAALELLAAGPEDAVLELGCGSGRLLFRLAARARRGFVVGIDPSELMVRHARHRNRRWIEAGRARVEQGHSADLSAFAEASLDRVLGVHVVCFWSDPRADLDEVRRVLKPGGRLLFGFQPGGPGAGTDPDPARVPVARVESWLRAAGFADVHTVAGGEAERPLAWVRARR